MSGIDGIARFDRVSASLAFALLAACDPVVGPAPPSKLSGEECALLGKAAEAAPQNQAPILAGCPGRFAAYRVSDADRLSFQGIAVGTTAPQGDLGTERLFEFLLIRGVPPEVADGLLKTNEFAAALRARA